MEECAWVACHGVLLLVCHSAILALFIRDNQQGERAKRPLSSVAEARDFLVACTSGQAKSNAGYHPQLAIVV